MTEKQEKIRSILEKYNSQDLLFVLHECVELLAPMSASELSAMLQVEKKTIHNRIKSGKYLTFDFINRRFPIMNDNR